MKLLLDQGLPRSAADGLRRAGHDAVHTGEIGLARSSDSDIIEHARRDGRVIVTLDADFHTQIALEDVASPSVIRIREEGLRADALVQLLVEVMRSCGEDLAKGAFVPATRDQARVRGLPIGRR
jgi:predicted nuclease of predicted toxin-antitoxin system